MPIERKGEAQKKMLNEIYTEHILGIIYNIDRSYATIQSIILV